MAEASYLTQQQTRTFLAGLSDLGRVAGWVRGDIRRVLKAGGAARGTIRSGGMKDPLGGSSRWVLPDCPVSASKAERCSAQRASGGTPSSPVLGSNLADMGLAGSARTLLAGSTRL
jgi:hypothetical protein